MPSVVQIEIQVDEAGAITGFRSLNAAGAQVTTTLKTMGQAGTQASQAVQAGSAQLTAAMERLEAAVVANTAAMGQMGQRGNTAFRTVSGGAHQSMLAVQLFRDEFGIHIPRAMERTMAQSKAVMGVLNSLMTSMIAVGYAGVAFEIGKQVYEVGKAFFEVDDAVKKFDEDLAKTARQKLMDTAPIEDLRKIIQGTTGDIAVLQGQLKKMPDSYASGFWQSLTLRGVSPDNVIAAGYDSFKNMQERQKKEALLNPEQAKNDKAREEEEERRHSKATADIEQERIRIDSMRDNNTRTDAETANDKRLNHENTLHEYNQRKLGTEINNRGLNPSDHDYQTFDPNAGLEAEQQTDQLTSAKGSAKKIELARQQGEELRKLQQEAAQVELKGFQLLEVQKAAALDEFTRKYAGDIASQVFVAKAQAAVSERFHKEELQRQQELERAIATREREANASGLTGLAGIQVRGANEQASIKDGVAEGRYSAYGSSDQQFAAMLRDQASAKKKTDAEIEAEERRFRDSVDQIAEASTDKQLQGFARISAEGKKELNALQQEFEKVYGQLDHGSQQYQNGLAILNRGKSAVTAGTDRQTTDLIQKNADENAKLQEEANRASLPQARQRSQQIRNEYEDELKTYQRMVDQKEITDADYLIRKAAAEKKMNAELAEDQRRQRDQLAGEIMPFFRNPQEAAIRLGEQQASKALASVLMRGTQSTPLDMSGGRHGGGLFDGLLHPHGDTAAAKGGSASKGSDASRAIERMVITSSYVVLNAQQLSFGSGSASGGHTFNAGAAGPLGSLPGAGASGIPGAAGGWGGGTGDGAPAYVSDAQNALGMGQSSADLGKQMFSGGGTNDGAPAYVSDTQNALGMGQSAADLGKQLFDKGSTMGKASSSLGNTLSKAAPVVGAGAAIYGAVESNGGVGGALQGAMGGMKLGSMVGGPVGGAIGAAAGAILGFIGIGGEQKARKYYDETVKPRIANDVTSFGMGSMDYQSAYTDLVSLDKDARQQTKQWGMGGKREWDDHIHPDIMKAQQTIQREQKAGRSQYGMTAAEFDGGGVINGFGDYSTTPGHGWIHAEVGETVMHTSATAMHGDALSLMLAGANRSQMADHYGAGPAQMAAMFSRAMQDAAASRNGATYNNGHTYNVNAIDTKSFNEALMANRHGVRRATNQSYLENSGGSDLG